MTHLPERFTEDRAMRDTARAVLSEDIEHLRASLAEQGIASRVSSGVSSTISSRIRTGARDAFAEAKAQAGERKGLIALIIAALVLWLSRRPLLDALEELLESDYDDEDPHPQQAALPDAAPDGDKP